MMTMPEAKVLIALDEIERGYVVRVLERCEGNRTAAAKILHIDRKTLSRKLRKWGIDMVV